MPLLVSYVDLNNSELFYFYLSKERMDENKKKEPITGRWAVGKRRKQLVSPLPTAGKPSVAQVPFRAPIKPPPLPGTASARGWPTSARSRSQRRMLLFPEASNAFLWSLSL